MRSRPGPVSDSGNGEDRRYWFIPAAIRKAQRTKRGWVDK
jgi:hypothetical protein